ncbi:ImmA/IrrE family metallo-endopeptidase [Pyruvatibacter mobilis]|uniref:ImmA/IrrE family metallo-endopeptidase n=1 Tax=Pyruvatibacter mobilis TaxID=1712261 RepID=UPI003D150D97
MITTNNVLPFPRAAQDSSLGRLLIPGRLTEARYAARLTQTELARLVEVSRQSVSAYELGTKSPEPETMRRLSVALGQPVHFFTKADRPTFGQHSTNFFRKIGADTKRRNQACEVLAEWFSSAAFAFDKIAKFPDVDIPQFEPSSSKSSSYTDEEIEDIAESVRKHFSLGLGPISNVLRLMESKGVLTCRFEVPGENVEAFSYWAGDKPFVFLASDKVSASRARFDAAHELGHLCMHRWVGKEEIEDKNRLKQIEGEANRFAGAFLLPRKSFPNEVYSARAESFVDLKARWKVSIQAMIYRCKDLGIFDDRQITNLHKQISYKKWRTVEPLDTGSMAIKFEEPILLKRVAEVVFESGRYREDELRADVALADETIEQLIGMKFSSQTSDGDDEYEPVLR